MEPPLNNLFPTANKTAWLAQVAKDLNDPAAYETLRWMTPEGFTLEPYYTADDLNPLPLAELQAAQKSVPGWLNAPEHRINDLKTDNITLRDALTRGADALVINEPAPTASDTAAQTSRLSRLLDGIKLSDTPVFFRIDTDPAAFTASLKRVAPYQLRGGLFVETGPATAEATRLTLDSPQFRTICVSSHSFHNAGATATQELAFTLAQMADAYDQLTDAGLTLDQLVPKTVLSVSVGTSYFVEIAKLRAIRVLLSRLLSAYSIPSIPCSLFLHCQTSTFYDATTTPYTNLLRATTESMAAVIGGCDALTVHPYDTVLNPPNEFSERIARNISVLLREESYLNKVADPSAGSYYLENLTHQFVEAAWTLFLRVEEMGGLANAFEAGFVQREIERAYQAKVEAVRNGKVLVGVNRFRFDENPLQASSGAPGLSHKAALPDRRLAQEFE